MSLMYDILDDYQDAYEAEMGEQDQALLAQAVQRLEEAYDEDSLEKHLEGFREACQLAGKLGDEQVTLIFDFHLANALIGTANRLDEGIEVVLPAAIKSRHRDYDDKPHRLGLNNMLASAYSGQDPVGFADEIRLIATMVQDSPLADAEDRFIAFGNLYESEIASGDLAAAIKSRDQVWDCAQELNSIIYFTSYATFETELAFLHQDWDGMLVGAERCWELLVKLQNEISDEEEEDEFEDADFLIVAAAEACALAKLGRSEEVDEPEVGNPDPEAPAQYNFYLYWCEFHRTCGNLDVAVAMAREGVEETEGKGQHFREIQMILLLIEMLSAGRQKAEIAKWTARARETAARLKDPGPMLQCLEALNS